MNEKIVLVRVGERGPGGAFNRFDYAAFDGVDPKPSIQGIIQFQDGDPAVVGVNGVTMEVLLSVIVDRLKDYEAGPFACEENHRAISLLDRALSNMKKRSHRVGREAMMAKQQAASGPPQY
jgi:hypothetical protein